MTKSSAQQSTTLRERREWTQIAIFTLAKSGLDTEFISNIALLELGSWINSLTTLTTGKRPIDPTIKRNMAKKNSAALKELIARKSA